jgi:ribosomal protein S18 acetylase RimI-like enzyme
VQRHGTLNIQPQYLFLCLLKEDVMALFTWWRTDPRPVLRELDGFHAMTSDDAHLLATLADLDVKEVERRLHSCHRPYVAYIGTTPVAYGWVALEGADIGELGIEFTLPSGDRYLWDFATLPAWRGRGIYPRLLQAILRAEERDAERFWIIHAPENGASQAGIEKAGFRCVGELSFRRDAGAGLVASDLPGHARVGAALLRVPLIDERSIVAAQEEPLSPCWHCVINARKSGAGDDAVACWPDTADALALAHPCTCGNGSSSSSIGADTPRTTEQGFVYLT